MAHTSQLSKAVVITDWKSLVRGDYVTVNQAGTPVGSGWLDDSTGDGSVVWLHMANGGGRRMFWRTGNFTLTVELA